MNDAYKVDIADMYLSPNSSSSFLLPSLSRKPALVSSREQAATSLKATCITLAIARSFDDIFRDGLIADELIEVDSTMRGSQTIGQGNSIYAYATSPVEREGG